MNILTRYILGEFYKIFGLCMLALTGIYYIVDIFNRIEIFINYDAPLVHKFSYFLYKLPLILYQIVPIALLITMVTVIGMMARHNELTAVKAGGVNLYVLTFPLVLSSLLLSMLIFVNNEYLLPSTNRRARYILDVKIKKKPPRGIFRQSRIWYVGKDNSIYNVDILDPNARTLEGISVIRFDGDYHPTERIDAKKAYPAAGGWVFEDAVRRVFAQGGKGIGSVERKDKLVVSIDESIDDFQKYKKDPDEMNYHELKTYVESLKRSGFNATAYEVDLLAKTSIPFISFVVAFLSIAMAVYGGTRGGVIASIGLCMAMGLAYWLVLSIGLSLGHAGRVHPLMASWGSNIIFGSAGVYFYMKLRQ